MKASGKCNPDFKLGIALAAADFNKQELVYCLAGSNFEEMTAGNAMKYASCVKNDGTFDFNTVKDFVTNAQDAGLTIYGHTLAWHSQQNKKYLSKLIADKEIQVDPSQKVEKTDYELDCSTLSSYDWTGSPASVKTEWNKGGAVVITNPEPIDPFYELQYWLVNGIPLKTGTKYKITFLCKAEGESPANIRFKLGNWGAGAKNTFKIPVGGDYKDGLLRAFSEDNLKTGFVVPSRLMWAMGNYSRFIRPGAVRYDVEALDASGNILPDGETQPYSVMVSAYKNRDGSWVVVAINYSEGFRNFALQAPLQDSWEMYRTSDVEGETLKPVGIMNGTTRLQPKSITTFVLK